MIKISIKSAENLTTTRECAENLVVTGESIGSLKFNTTIDRKSNIY